MKLSPSILFLSSLSFALPLVACGGSDDIPEASNAGATGGSTSSSTPSTGGATASETGGSTSESTGGETAAGTGGETAAGTGGETAAGTGGETAAGTGGETATPPPVDPPGQSCAVGTNYDIGEMRILNNQWTEVQDDQCIIINDDRTFGWTWDMNTSSTNPNYPEVEFGINPWGREKDGWEVGTSSTTLLPIQLKDLTSASMTIDITTETNNKGWNLAFETWLSPVDPTTQETEPEAEIMVFFGNDPTYWPTEAAGGNIGGYTLYDSNEDRGYFYAQYRKVDMDGTAEFNGTLDIKQFLDTQGFDQNWWITRFEIGNEVYDGSKGTTTIRSLSFEVNGESRDAL